MRTMETTESAAWTRRSPASAVEPLRRAVPFREGRAPFRLRLVCFPFAGGNAALFRGWAGRLLDGVEVCAVEMPGHGVRLAEPPCTAMGELVAGLAPAVRALVGDAPFALLGHSLGGIVAYEVARHLRATDGLLPVRLLVSASRAPHVAPSTRPLHELPDEQFLAHLRRYNGIPRAVEESPELLRLMLPVVRADMRVYETYRHEVGAPLPCAISAFAGNDDEWVPYARVDRWRDLTTASFDLTSIRGDHFFVRDSTSPFFSALADRIAEIAA
jgi:surfactin synthase thioesterase subunit